MGLWSYIFGLSPFDYFVNIKTVTLKCKKGLEGNTMEMEKTFDFTEYYFPQIKETMEEMIKDVTIEDTLEAKFEINDVSKPTFSNSCYTVKGHNEINDIIELFDELNKFEVSKDEFKYNIELFFKNASVPFYKNTVDIKQLEKYCEKMTTSYAITVDPIEVKKGDFSLKREGLKLEGVTPRVILKKIKSLEVHEK